VNLSADDFSELGAGMMNRRPPSEGGSAVTMDERFRSLFGVSAVVCAHLWALLCKEEMLPDDCTAVCLLWALMFLKTHDTEKNLSNVAGGVDANTFVKWTWIVLEGIVEMEFRVVSAHPSIAQHLMGDCSSQLLSISIQIVWENRKRIDLGNDCLVSVDGADFVMQGFPSVPFCKQKAWFTKKHNGPGIRCEVGLSILGSDIVWIHGGFPCGDWPDIEIFRHALMHFLDPHERVETDKGCRGEDPEHVKRPGLLPKDDPVEIVRESICGRHETANEKFKNFNVLMLPFRHDIDKHPTCFRAVAVLTQLAIKNGDPLFTVSCNNE